MSTTLSDALAALRPAFTGRILTPDHVDYETTRTVFLGDIDRRPALILRPAGAADVARETGLTAARAIQRAMAKERADRFDSATEFVAALEN
ncbi:MAG: hypothetical protein HYU84_18415 [Chloroflexi bacterium]|nr:hypothetical protein [Chloroflexota bacterium]MBI3158320.1 hypothetical protein [Chloroflexota bacterium]